jgi:preprotein translocase subunit SecD
MLDFPPWKKWMVIAVTAIGILLALPSFAPVSWAPQWYQDIRISLGLDLKGGSHLLLAADTRDVQKVRMEKMEESVSQELRRAEPRIEIGDMSTQGGVLSFMVRDTQQLDTAVEKARSLTNGVGIAGQRDWTVAVRDGNMIVMTPTAAGLADEINKSMETARAVIARRIDEMGTKEATVIRQGTDRILVQVPGLGDPEKLKALVGKTARLEFKLVDLTATPEQIKTGTAPPGSQILPYPGSQFGAIALQRRVMVSGDHLIDATQTFDPQDNTPVVSIRFNAQGGTRFARATQENVGKPFAIIVDNVVISAPNINEPILGGSAQISGGFTVEGANELAVQLRSGKLPVALNVIEESTVFYMLLTYFRFGVYTTIALLLNALLVLGGMALFNATLTLPGIAGFVLTIGAAVDANVLINERIREEVRRGRQSIQAVELGYKEASTAIFDANITNVISAVILFWFGSGPIKGFAVVLAIGIVTSVFTGVTFTRLMVADYLERNRPRELNL